MGDEKCRGNGITLHLVELKLALASCSIPPSSLSLTWPRLFIESHSGVEYIILLLNSSNRCDKSLNTYPSTVLAKYASTQSRKVDSENQISKVISGASIKSTFETMNVMYLYYSTASTTMLVLVGLVTLRRSTLDPDIPFACPVFLSGEDFSFHLSESCANSLLTESSHPAKSLSLSVSCSLARTRIASSSFANSLTFSV